MNRNLVALVCVVGFVAGEVGCGKSGSGDPSSPGTPEGPAIGLSSTGLAFSAVVGGTSPTAQAVTVSNSGGGTLAVPVASVSYASGSSWLTVSVSGTAVPFTLAVQPIISGLSPGTYAATVFVTAAAASNSPRQLSVTFTLAAAPAVQLSTSSVSFAATAGGSNPAPQVVTVSNSGGEGLALPVASITYGSGGGWLSATVSGSTAPYVISFQPNLAGLSALGTYTATVSVASTGASNTPQSVSVTLVLGGPPSIQVSSTGLSFVGTTGGSNPTAQSVTVANSGGGSLPTPLTSVSYAAGIGWLSVTATGTTAPYLLTIQPDVAGLSPGTYSATLSVSCPGVSNSPVTISIALTLSAPPTIQLSASSLTFAQAGATPPASQSVTVSNSGGGTLAAPTVSVTYGSGTNWLTATPVGSASPFTITVSPHIAGLSAGTYAATISVSSMGASNAPQNISVSLTVNVPLFQLGGTISGLKGDGLVLATVGEPNLALAAGATTFSFADPLPGGTAYAIAVAQQPTNPAALCSVERGAGTVGTANVTNISVVCVPLWSQATAGGTFTAAIKTDGTLWAWGNNGYGQLGSNTTEQHASPMQVGIDDKWAMVAAGNGHTVAVKSDGTLWCWGSNVYGQVGNGSSTDRYSPTQIGTDSDWVWVAAGTFHTLAKKRNGALWGWGFNAWGQLGIGGTATTWNVPALVGNGYTSVAVGYGHTVATRGDGTLWVWGLNDKGQLGTGYSSPTLQRSPVQVGSDADWLSVSAGRHTSAALKSDNTLWMWGYNFAGGVGNGSYNDQLVPGPVKSGMVAVTTGNHSLGIQLNGTLWAWGYNAFGQLGFGGTTGTPSPLQVGAEDTWESVSAGSTHSVALKKDGTLWTWGDNTYGQIGNGTTVQQNVPAQVGN